VHLDYTRHKAGKADRRHGPLPGRFSVAPMVPMMGLSLYRGLILPIEAIADFFLH
jgi:hypothetical protein